MRMVRCNLHAIMLFVVDVVVVDAVPSAVCRAEHRIVSIRFNEVWQTE